MQKERPYWPLLFFCVIKNSLHTAGNYLWILFISCCKKVLQLPATHLVCQCLNSHPNSFCLSNCMFVFITIAVCCLESVCACLRTPFLARELELPWRRKHFSFHFCVLVCFFPGGLCFLFCLVWELNHPTLLLRTAFGFLMLPRAFECRGGWCRGKGLRKAFNFILTALCPYRSVLEAQRSRFRKPLCLHEGPLQKELMFPMCLNRKLTLAPVRFHMVLFVFFFLQAWKRKIWGWRQHQLEWHRESPSSVAGRWWGHILPVVWWKPAAPCHSFP